MISELTQQLLGMLLDFLVMWMPHEVEELVDKSLLHVEKQVLQILVLVVLEDNIEGFKSLSQEIGFCQIKGGNKRTDQHLGGSKDLLCSKRNHKDQFWEDIVHLGESSLIQGDEILDNVDISFAKLLEFGIKVIWLLEEHDILEQVSKEQDILDWVFAGVDLLEQNHYYLFEVCINKAVLIISV